MASLRRSFWRWGAVLIGGFVLFSASACRSTTKAPSVSPSDAAATVASAFALPDEQKACLEQAFHDHPDATRPLATDRTADDVDITALGEVENGCIHVDTLAAAVTSGAADGFGTITDQQKTCLNDSINGLSDDERVTLLAGFTVPQSLSDAKATELGRVANGILDACNLSIDTTPTT